MRRGTCWPVFVGVWERSNVKVSMSTGKSEHDVPFSTVNGFMLRLSQVQQELSNLQVRTMWSHEDKIQQWELTVETLLPVNGAFSGKSVNHLVFKMQEKSENCWEAKVTSWNAHFIQPIHNIKSNGERQQNRERQQILTFEKLKPQNDNWLKLFIGNQNCWFIHVNRLIRCSFKLDWSVWRMTRCIWLNNEMKGNPGFQIALCWSLLNLFCIFHIIILY